MQHCTVSTLRRRGVGFQMPCRVPATPSPLRCRARITAGIQLSAGHDKRNAGGVYADGLQVDSMTDTAAKALLGQEDSRFVDVFAES